MILTPGIWALETLKLSGTDRFAVHHTSSPDKPWTKASDARASSTPSLRQVHSSLFGWNASPTWYQGEVPLWTPYPESPAAHCDKDCTKMILCIGHLKMKRCVHIAALENCLDQEKSPSREAECQDCAWTAPFCHWSFQKGVPPVSSFGSAPSREVLEPKARFCHTNDRRHCLSTRQGILLDVKPTAEAKRFKRYLATVPRLSKARRSAHVLAGAPHRTIRREEWRRSIHYQCLCWFSYVLNRFQYKLQSQYTAMYKTRIFTLSISCCFRKKNFSSKDCTSGAGILATFVLFRIKVRTLQTKGLRTKQSETPHPSAVTKMHEMSSDSGYLWLHLPVGAQTSKMTL